MRADATTNLEGRDRMTSAEDQKRDDQGISAPPSRVRMVAVLKVDMQCERADVCGYAAELERLEYRPAKEHLVCGNELAQVLGECLVGLNRLLLRGRKHAGGMLADCLVRRPVALLAVL